MAENKIDKYLKISTIVFVIGLVVIAAGIYFSVNELTSSGVKMGRFGNRGTGTIDGKGMVFCGIIIACCGFFFRDKKKSGEDT